MRTTTLTRTQRRRALAAAYGSAVFVVAWIVGGFTVGGYSTLDYSVSRLAAVGTPHRWVMTIGFVALGAGLLAYAPSLRVALPGLGWITALATGLGTIGVAFFPPDGPSRPLHGLCAALAYIGLAATPLFCIRAFVNDGAIWTARACAATGVLTGACLELAHVAPHGGLIQRVGFTVGQAWVSVTAIIMYRRGALLAQGAPTKSRPTPGPAR